MIQLQAVLYLKKEYEAFFLHKKAMDNQLDFVYFLSIVFLSGEGKK
jgi:hypothetical protein